MTLPPEKCIIVCAPSGAGKTTIVKFLLGTFPDLRFSVSATSREKRTGEVNGKDYYFISAEDFRTGIDADEFLEWEEVYDGRYYGTLKREIRRIWDAGKHVVFDVDVVGALNLKTFFGKKALSVFVQPPDMEVLEHRLRRRGTENGQELARRLDKAAYEMTFAHSFDKILVNDDLDRAKAEVKEWVQNFLES